MIGIAANWKAATYQAKYVIFTEIYLGGYPI
jgi:hypothetical protein